MKSRSASRVPVGMAFTVVCGMISVLPGGRHFANLELPHLRFSVNDLVLSQTGNTNKQDESRFCDGDRVVEWDGTSVRDNDHLVELWLACAGRDSVNVLVEREMGTADEPDPQRLEIDYPLVYASEVFAAMCAGGRDEYVAAADLFPELLEESASPLQEIALKMLQDTEPQALHRLYETFRRSTEVIRGHYRSDSIMFLLNRPLHAPYWARSEIDAIASADTIRSVITRGFRLASPRLESLPEHPDIEAGGDSLEEICSQITKEVNEIREHLRAASAAMTPEERQTWNQWCREIEPKWRGEAGWDEFAAGFQLTKKLDVGELKEAWSRSAALADALHPGGTLHRQLAQLAEIPEQPIRIGDVQVGSVADSVHEVSASVIIEFGGNDTYVFPDEGLDPQSPLRVIVDLSGDDQYQAETNGIAAGVAGVSILIDVAGNDVYDSRQNGSGFAVCGMGLLVDCAGQDRYLGETFVQGAACVGVGVVIDRHGNDIYDAGHYSQAIGMPGGFGGFIDEQGDDQFLCTGKFPSPYGDQGEFEGFGQGCGFGFRGLGCGGIGMLLDKQGRDVYRAGQFGLGCGYFFGIGVVNDRSGNDVFECSRYGLGSAAHYAAGLVLDDDGDDTYLAMRSAAVAELGSSWDLSLGCLVDGGGNDVYRCQTYALGGAAQNAYGIFWDKGGDDTYLTGTNPGDAGPYVGGANYGAGRGARNLSIFLDESGDDSYTDNKTNQASGVQGEYGIWLDR